MAVSFKGAHFPQDIILPCVRWYVAYPLSTRHIEELMLERGVHVDHSTVNRWVIKYSPQLEEAFHRRKRPVWVSWRMDETYIKVKGQWYYLYRAVDKTGQTIDFLLTEQRDEQAAKRFLTKASAATVCPRRSRSTGVQPMKRPSRAITRSMAPRLKSARSSISTILWSKTIEP
jgi:putative transposase